MNVLFSDYVNSLPKPLSAQIYTSAPAGSIALTETSAPRFLLPHANGNVLWLIYHELLDAGSVPAGRDFTVKVNFLNQAPPINVTVADNIVTLTLAAALKPGQFITVSYTPGTNPIRDTAGNNAAAFSNVLGLNSTGGMVPLLLRLPSVKSGLLQFIYHEPLDPASLPAGIDFTINVNGMAQEAPTGVAIAGSIVTLTLAKAVKAGDLVFAGYTPGSCPLRYKPGYNAGLLANMPVTNLTEEDHTAPVLHTASVDKATLLLSYNEPLDPDFVPAGTDFSIKADGLIQGAPVQVTLADSIVTLALSQAVYAGQQVTVSYNPGSNALRDVAGNHVAALTEQPVVNNTAGLIAPPVDPTVATSIYHSTAFLYTGDHPVQTGMSPDTIEVRRAAVLRGKVTDRTGNPVAGVIISVAGHEEYGETRTREDGYFDMAVNGGGLLTVNYQKEGYLPVHRQMTVPWQDFALLPDVTLVSYDSSVTAIDLNASAMQVAQGSQVTDTAGTRRAVLLVPRGTTAEITLADGTKQSIVNFHVRATEYTVGDSGPAAMPGELPPNVGYTYAVEYSVDEAVAAGAKEVRFDRPLIHYVENFLHFPVGGIVPVGYYDREKTAWLPSDNGRIVKIVSISGGLADLDITGDGTVADIAALADLGVTDEERQQLAGRYQSGQELWRVPITHFTPWDCGWSFCAPASAERPKLPELKRDEQPPYVGEGSIIEYQTQVLGETKTIVGTPFNLCYYSRNAYGYKSSRSVVIPLVGATVPPGITSIRLEITVAGRRFVQAFAAAPNLSHTFTWDGKDAFGRIMPGTQLVKVGIGYVYQAEYQSPTNISQSFGTFSGAPLAGASINEELVFWEYMTTTVTLWTAVDQGLGGWTLDAHHAYDPVGQLLLRGDGGRRNARSESYSIVTVAGNGTAGNGGDGGPATAAQFNWPQYVDFAADGSLYIVDSNNNCIRRVGPEGIVTTVAGNGTAGYSGDGGPAVAAQLNWPQGIAIGTDGSLFITDYQNNCVRRVDPAGIITTVVGNGTIGRSGDGGPATAAQLKHPKGVTVGANGSLYIADFGNNQIRRVRPDGIITTVAGTGYPDYYGDGGPATAADLWQPIDVALGPDGSMYIADAANQRIRRVGPDGIITTVAGTDRVGYSGDGGPATAARLTLPVGITVGPDGSLYIAEMANNCIRRVGPDGIITTVAGNGIQGYSGDSGPAAASQLNTPQNVAIGADGSLYITDRDNNRIRRAAFCLPGICADETPFPAEDGSEVYVFDAQGRHLRTVSPLNGVLIYQFNYDTAGQLISAQDVDGNITTIERDAGGKATGIIAPGGLRTGLTLDDSGYLQGITCPTGKTVRLTYDSDGLLTSFTDNRNNAHQFTYDASGYLSKDEDPSGGYTALSRNESSTGYVVAATTALGRKSSYTADYLTTGGMRRTNTDPAGAREIIELATDGTTTVTNPDGTVVKTAEGPDPRWEMQAPLIKSLIMTTPGGLQFTKTQTGVAIFDSADPTKVSTLTYTSSFNGKDYTNTYDADANQITETSPLGLKTFTVLDEKGHVVRTGQEDLDPVNYKYDNLGRVTEAGQGDQSVTYAYDSKNRISSAADTAGNQYWYEYDDNNNITKVTLPNGSSYQYAYDDNDNCIQVIMPSGAVHTLGYTVLDQNASYAPPGNAAYTVSYDKDKEPVRDVLPGSRAVDTSYDSGGRMTGKSFDAAMINMVYPDATDRMGSITRVPSDGSTAQSIAYVYDGRLITKMAMSGVTNGQYSYRYDNDFLPVGITLDDGPELAITRNDDGKLTGYGPFTIDRGGPAGAPNKVSDGKMTVNLGYDSVGRMIERSHTVNGQQEYGLRVAYNNIGKITQKSENITGVSNTYDYTYDSIGQLTQVKKNGTVVETYAYDVNGNRTIRRLGVHAAETATYDAQDRLTKLGDASYSFDADGFLIQRGGDSFTYSATGELLKATLAGGAVVTYAYDGTGRMVARTVNSQTWQYLYGSLNDPYRITATRQPDGTLTGYYYDGAGLLFALERGGTRYSVACDQVGTPKVVADPVGNVVKLLEYDSCGNLVSDSAPDFYLPIGFASGIADPETGLVRFGLRDYDPAAGRWTARDPVFFQGGQGNLYVYCGNDAVKYRDPSGQCVLLLVLSEIQILLCLLLLIMLWVLFTKGQKPPTGSYTNTHQSGKKYHGKGPESRAKQSGKQKEDKYGDPLESTDWKESPTERDAFKDEHRRLDKDHGPDNPKNYNKINSPGKKYIEEDSGYH